MKINNWYGTRVPHFVIKRARWFGVIRDTHIRLFCSADGGRCVAFNPNDDTMFLVGTDEGIIYKCTTEYSSRSANISPFSFTALLLRFQFLNSGFSRRTLLTTPRSTTFPGTPTFPQSSSLARPSGWSRSGTTSQRNRFSCSTSTHRLEMSLGHHTQGK